MKGVAVFLLSSVFLGCGYSFQQSRNPLLDRYGIRTVYISPLANNSYKPGAENLVYNELVRTVSANRRVRLVPRREDADAVLSGSVTDASYARTGTTTADLLFPKGAYGVPPGSSKIPVATEYQASLGCTFVLTGLVRQGLRQNETVVWSGNFPRSKPFPGNNQLGPFGTTSPLINDSEFDRALRELARSISEDLHESMLAMF